MLTLQYWSGCGIGVLLRMLFVLAIVMYRAVKGQRGEEQCKYSQITIIEEYVESPKPSLKFSPLSYADEKFPIKKVENNPKSSPPSYADGKYPVVVETVNTPSTPEESNSLQLGVYIYI